MSVTVTYPRPEVQGSTADAGLDLEVGGYAWVEAQDPAAATLPDTRS